jgi:hypothetical protein
MLSNIFGQLSEIKEEICPEISVVPKQEIEFVSFEQALKELITQKNP